jgi:hypothetical protein
MPLFSKIYTQSAENPNTVGLLGNIFPLEVLYRVWDFLPLTDVIAYGNSSGVTRLQIQDFLRKVCNDEIRRFCNNPQALQNLLWQTKSVISGSVALASIIPIELRDWQPSDMDIYTSPKAVNHIMTHMVEVEGYIVDKRVKSRDADYSGLGSIKEVIKLTNSRGQHVDIINANQKASLTAIGHFYGSQVRNAITGRGVISLYPKETLEYRVILNVSALRQGIIPLAVQRCMVKYPQRGFRFDINAVRYMGAAHECRKSFSCPHTFRNIFDGGVLALAYHDNAKCGDEFVPNSMGATYNGRYGNLWCMGGDACKLEDSRPISTDPSLSEFRFR